MDWPYADVPMTLWFLGMAAVLANSAHVVVPRLSGQFRRALLITRSRQQQSSYIC